MDINDQILELITKMNADMQHGFDKINSDMNERFDKVNSDMNERFDKINSDMNERFDEVYSTMQEEFKNVYAEFKDIRMTLENETNPSIRIIAEGHYDLNKKLDNVSKVENEKELALLRITRLENEVRQLKTKIG